MKRSFITVTVFSLLLLTASGARSRNREQHPIDPVRGCETCHALGTKENQSTGLKNDISAACIDCHPPKVTDHPIGNIPDVKVPADMPLSEEGKLTCVTCHNPHSERYSDRPWQASSIAKRMADLIKRKNEYSTYFLRRNNAHGELCMTCHGG